MLGVLQKAFQDSRRTVFWLCFGFGVYTIFIMSFFPTIVAQNDEITALMDSYPPEMMSMFMGGSDIADFDFTDPATYLQAEYITWFILIMGAMMTAQAFNAILNAERNGTLDLMLSLPVTRRQVIIGRIINTGLSIFAVLTTVFVAVALLQNLYDDFDIPLGNLAQGIYGLFFLLMTQVSLAYMLGSLSPSRQSWAGPVALTYFFAAYILNGFAANVEWLETFRPIYIFNYYNLVDFTNNGVNIGDSLVLLVLSGVFIGVAVWAFERKELGI